MAHEMASNLPATGSGQEAANAPVAAEHGPGHTEHGGLAHKLLGLENRKLGIWLFLCSEIMFFTVLIGTNQMARWKDPGPHEVLNIQLTALNTFILLTSSFTVVWALSGLQQGNRKKFLRALLLSMLFGATFVGIQAYEYTNLSHDGFVLSANLYTNSFFVLTGFHGSHVIVGLIWLGRLFIRGFNGSYSAENYEEFELAGLYWHFVDIVWIILFVIVYLL
jgi:cytochrome c oxidase subunit 3/cytochrome o ubiquinol oxidase subunit 3